LPRARLRWWWMSHQTGVRQPLTMARHSRVRHYFGAVYARTKAACVGKTRGIMRDGCTSEQSRWFAAGTHAGRKLSGAVWLWMHSRVSSLRQHARKLPDRRRICRAVTFRRGDTEVESDDRYGLPRHGPRDTRSRPPVNTPSGRRRPPLTCRSLREAVALSRRGTRYTAGHTS